ncbi:Major facilitator superfamily domain-containing protein 6-B [Eufriesea mexicana]|uniref:Major facilitator superfamily domain-containing protein 6-B n=1 Tax=Eufriesea mexicana TaxID=516756 RepID=A0A310SA41_9HYME|nr:Major facilitator superfamily domain-containing protein 6-B [Eufriesea mexicana]
MFGNINKELLPIKAHYFLFNAATGPVVPFLPTIAKQLGFSGLLVGTIYTILPISGLVTKPLFVTIAMFTIYFIPEIDNNANVNLTCNGDASLEMCSKHGFSDNVIHNVITETTHLNVSCQVSCKASKEIYTQMCVYWKAFQFCDLVNSSSILDSDTFDFTLTFDMFHDSYMNKCMYVRIFTARFSDNKPYKPVCESHVRTSCTATCYDSPTFNQLLHEIGDFQNSTQNSTYQFHSFLWATTISWIGMAVVVSIADAICFNLLGNERRKEYGKQKMWSSIGFGIFGISAGYMKNPEYSEDEPSTLWELFSILRKSNILAFGWWCIGAGMCTSVVWNFLFWYTEDLANSSQIKWLKTLQGLLTGVQSFLGELPFNFISGNILRKLGHVNVMSLVLLIYAIRFMVYSTISNPWWFLIIEILHGPSLGLCWPTMVSYGDKVTPPGTKGTIQGFIGAIFEGIGVSTGSLICGWLIDTYGCVTMLRVFSVGALLWLSCFWLFQLLLRKFKTSPIHTGHNHLANYANPDDAILMTMSRELQTY